METQAKILNVENARGRVSIEADIPALGQYPIKFVRWTGAGNAPTIGAEMLVTMEPTTRQTRFLRDGTFAGETIDGEEMPWQVNWQMTGARPIEDNNGAEVENTTGAAPTSRSAAPGGRNGAVWMDANLRYRVDTQMINDREAVRQAIAFGAAEGGNIIADLSTVLAMAGELAEWWNARFLARLAGDSPLVAHAESLGAVLTDVQDAPEAPAVKNEAELRTWVEGQGWSREAVVEAIRSAGYDSASAYLAVGGHTASGLASILTERLA
jgi:hypothetical protein